MFGDVLSTINTNFRRSLPQELFCDMSHVDSLDGAVSSSDKENVNHGRKRCLDDALFQFFRKEAVKSLKSDFSKFLNESDAWFKTESVDQHALSRDDFFSYSLKYYGKVLISMSKHRKF